MVDGVLEMSLAFLRPPPGGDGEDCVPCLDALSKFAHLFANITISDNAETTAPISFMALRTMGGVKHNFL